MKRNKVFVHFWNGFSFIMFGKLFCKCKTEINACWTIFKCLLSIKCSGAYEASKTLWKGVKMDKRLAARVTLLNKEVDNKRFHVTSILFKHFLKEVSSEQISAVKGLWSFNEEWCIYPCWKIPILLDKKVGLFPRNFQMSSKCWKEPKYDKN